MKHSEITTNTCIVDIDDFGIIHKTVRAHSHIDADDIKESDEIGFKLSKGKKALILYDARPSFTLTDKAMEYLHKNLLSKRRLASAIVSDKPGIKMLGDYFKNGKANNPQIRVFKTMKEAMSWLLSFKGITKALQVKEKKIVIGKHVIRPKSVVAGLPKGNIKSTITTCIAKVEVDNNNVAYKRVLEDSHIDLASLKKSFSETMAFLGPEKRFMIYDLRPHFTITDDALDFVIDKIMGEHGIATAILANTIGVYIMADYAIKVKKIKSPLKVFTDEKQAIKWLSSQPVKA